MASLDTLKAHDCAEGSILVPHPHTPFQECEVVTPGNRSMAQYQGRCGGRLVALCPMEMALHWIWQLSKQQGDEASHLNVPTVEAYLFWERWGWSTTLEPMLLERELSIRWLRLKLDCYLSIDWERSAVESLVVSYQTWLLFFKWHWVILHTILTIKLG